MRGKKSVGLNILSFIIEDIIPKTRITPITTTLTSNLTQHPQISII